MLSAVEILNQPLTFPFSGKTVKNRFMKSAMSERLATFSTTDPLDRGKPTPGLTRVYETWGKGGLGLILTGNIMVNRDHLEGRANTIIDASLLSSNLDEWTELARVARADGALILGQLSHTGRQTDKSIQLQPISASDISLPDSPFMFYAKPKPATKRDIEEITAAFAHAAKLLYQSGFDGVELHAAHGYIFSQFLAPRTNKRTDEYGGSLANRSRLLLEVIAAMKEAVDDPSFIYAVKLNSQDFVEDGFTAEESRELSIMLQDAGIDLIELSGGTHENVVFEHKKESTKAREAFFLDFAEKLRPNLTVSKLVVTGGFQTAAVMAQSVTDGLTDLIGMGRPLAAEPHIVKDLLSGKKLSVQRTKIPPVLGIAAATAQLGEIASGVPITDYSIQENANTLTDTMTRLLAVEGPIA